MHPLIIIPIILKLQLVKCMFCQPTYSPSQKSGLSKQRPGFIMNPTNAWRVYFKTEMYISFSLDSFKMCFHFQNLVLWYYQCFKNVLSFSIETDLWHKARITNITFESLLSFMNWFNVWIQKFAFGNESTFWNCQN